MKPRTAREWRALREDAARKLEGIAAKTDDGRELHIEENDPRFWEFHDRLVVLLAAEHASDLEAGVAFAQFVDSVQMHITARAHAEQVRARRAAGGRQNRKIDRDAVRRCEAELVALGLSERDRNRRLLRKFPMSRGHLRKLLQRRKGAPN